MGLSLSADNIAALEARTKGWIAGLQLAALSMQGRSDAAGFITSFTGSHRFVLDYLVEEVLGRQPAPIQTFLLRTSILDPLPRGDRRHEPGVLALVLQSAGGALGQPQPPQQRAHRHPLDEEREQHHAVGHHAQEIAVSEGSRQSRRWAPAR
jgi:hypothetical protein